MRRILPYPLLSFSIVIMWLVLSGFSLGQCIIGMIVGVFGGILMQLLQPEKVHIHSWGAIIVLFFRVVVDVTTSNLAVARYILFGGRKGHRSGFIIIPLELKSRTGLAVLACVMTATPGTAWVSYNSKNSELLVHVLDLTDEEYWQQLIKRRYETLLLEIFQ
ncbi:Na+/H+ antiporter subunit E [Bartonella sp. LJL80]